MKTLKSTKLYPEWFLKKKPYAHFDDYDKYYLELTQRIYQLLLLFPVNKDKLKDQDIKEVAYALVSYFEDVVNEIGIWDALKKKHLKLYSTPVPDFVLPNSTSYDNDYINKEDIQFILWNYFLRIKPDFIIPAHSSYFDTISNLVFEEFEDEFEDAMVTDYYNDFFTIHATDDFFMLKTKLNWFAFNNYILGSELSLSHQLANEKIKAKSKEEAAFVGISNLEDTFFKTTTQWSSLTAIELFAAVAKTNDETRETIYNLKNRHLDKYIFEGKDDTYFMYRSVLTDKIYNVLIDSFSPGAKFTVGDFSLATFIKWNNQWHLSGSSINNKATEEGIESWKKDAPAYVHYSLIEKYRKNVSEIMAEMYSAFVAFFNDDIAWFNSNDELQKGMTNYYSYYNQKLSEKYKSSKDSSGEPNLEVYNDFDGESDICWFFNKNMGPEAVLNPKKMIYLLKQNFDELEEDEEQFLYDFVLDEFISAQFIMSIFKKENLTNLGRVFKIKNITEETLEFYLRLYKPYDYKNEMPRLTLQ